MKKLVCAIVILSMLLTSTAAFASGNALRLTIDEALELVVKNSRQIYIDELDIRVKEIILQDSKYDQVLTSAPSLENEYKTGVKPIEVETNLEVAKRKRVNNEKDLRQKVYNAALDILLIEKELDTEKQKLKISEEKNEILKARYSQNLIIINDVYDVEYELESREINIDKVQNSLEAANLEFKKLLNLPLDDNKEIVLKDGLKASEKAEYDIESVINSSLTNNASVYEKSQNVKAKEKDLENIGHYLHQGNSTYDSAMYDLEVAKIELKETRNNLESDIRNKYNDLLNQSDALELAERFFVIAGKKFKAAQIKYDSGAISKEEYLTEKEKYLDAEYQKFAAIHDYNIVKAEFENLIGEY